jgi:hypothetical protein
MRVKCRIDEEITENTEIIFEPAKIKNVLIAATIDVVRDNSITVQIVNAEEKSIELTEDMIVGEVSLLKESEDNEEYEICQIEKQDTDWIKKIEIGDENIPSDERKKITNLVMKYSDVFSKHSGEVGRCGIIPHSIDIEGAKPRRCGVRPLNPSLRGELKNQLQELINNDFIQPSCSEYASGVVLVKKKDGTVRFCCDFRNLNTVTRKDAYPLPRITEVIDTLAGGKVFSTLDLKSGYHQITMHPEDMHKTAFITQHGLYEWKVLPMGLTNAPATFERVMELVMNGLTWEAVLVYLDDIIVF